MPLLLISGRAVPPVAGKLSRYTSALPKIEVYSSYGNIGNIFNLIGFFNFAFHHHQSARRTGPTTVIFAVGISLRILVASNGNARSEHGLYLSLDPADKISKKTLSLSSLLITIFCIFLKSKGIPKKLELTYLLFLLRKKPYELISATTSEQKKPKEKT